MVGDWDAYFVERAGGVFEIVCETVSVSLNVNGLQAVFSATGTNDLRKQVFSSFRVQGHYVFAETLIQNWHQPAGNSQIMLQLQPNKQVLMGGLLYVGDTTGHVRYSRHAWIRKNCRDPHLKKMVIKAMEKAKQVFTEEYLGWPTS